MEGCTYWNQHFWYRILPLCCFTKVVGELLHKCVECYSDNIFVFTKENNFTLHLQHCCLFLAKVQEFNMSLKPSKSFIGMSSLNIVGWKLSKTGVEVNPDKLQAIHDYQFPLSKKAMRRFLGKPISHSHSNVCAYR